MNDVSLRGVGPLSPDGAGLAAGAAAAPEEESFLRQYLLVAKRRKWLILGATVIVLLFGLIVTLMMTPQYSAHTTIEIQRDNYKITGVEGVEPETAAADMEFYQTQYGILRSQSLAQRVATELRLMDNPSFFEMFGAPEADQWFENGRLRAGAPPREVRVRKAGEILGRNVGVNPVRLSRLVTVTFTSPDPAFSAQVANEWSEDFIELTLARRFEATSYARRFLEGRLAQLRARLEASERALVGYASQEGIINIPTATNTPEDGDARERSIVADNLSFLNRELAQATSDRIAAQSRLQSGNRAVAETLNNDAITGLRQRRAEAAAAYSQMMVQFEPEYPAAVALREQIAQLDRSIASEEERVRGSLRGTYDASLARERTLASQVGELKEGLIDLRRRSIQYNIFQREVDTNRELYNALLQRYKEIGVAGGVGVNNVSIVDEAEIPQQPSSPRLILNLILSLLAGIALGFALAFIREQVDDDVADPSELEGALKLPMLGGIPKSDDADLIHALRDRKSEVTEAYLSVQTNLSFSTTHGVPRTLTVTSTRPGEGKSTTAYALARSLARSGSKVLLLDGDMRSPSVHTVLGLHNDRGLSNYLSGDDNLLGLVQRPEDEDFAVIAAGPQPPSAAELLSGERLGLMMKALQDHFDHVVVDAPPVMGLADAPLLAAHVEGVVFVLQSHSTKISPARIAIGRLRLAQGNIIGAVLTKFEARKTNYGYGYGYGYGKAEATA